MLLPHTDVKEKSVESCSLWLYCVSESYSRYLLRERAWVEEVRVASQTRDEKTASTITDKRPDQHFEVFPSNYPVYNTVFKPTTYWNHDVRRPEWTSLPVRGDRVLYKYLYTRRLQQRAPRVVISSCPPLSSSQPLSESAQARRNLLINKGLRHCAGIQISSSLHPHRAATVQYCVSRPTN